MITDPNPRAPRISILFMLEPNIYKLDLLWATWSLREKTP